MISLTKTIMRALPTSIQDALISRFPKLTYNAADREHIIRLSHPLYGKLICQLNPRYKIDKLLMYNHVYDKKTVTYISHCVHEGDICIDVGANMGAMTFALANALSGSGHVYAYEPGPLLFSRLQKNLNCNERLSRLVSAIDIGLSDRSGQLDWVLDRENYGNAILVDVGQGELSIPVNTLDSEVKRLEITSVDFIKIDVEGMEFEVLNGSRYTLERFHPIILFETWIRDDKNEKIPLVLRLLEEFGYQFYESSVGEAELEGANFVIRLMPTTYPNLPSNIVAVHTSRLDRVNIA